MLQQPFKKENLGLSQFVDPRREHLEKVLDSQVFARANQLRSLLRWLGHAALVEGAKIPSERDVAENVLHRHEFDPQTDSLVRKEMGRLRDKLTRYYNNREPGDGWKIVLPGGYRVQFEPNGVLRTAVSTSTRVLWLPFRAEECDAAEADRLWEDMLVRLSETVDVVPPFQALEARGQFSKRTQLARECDATHIVDGRYCSAPLPGITIWITRCERLRVERAQKIEMTLDSRQFTREVADKISSMIKTNWKTNGSSRQPTTPARQSAKC